MNTLIVADGDVPVRATLDRMMGSVAPQLVVAADGGAAKAVALGFTPDVVVGDFDSLAPDAADKMRADGVDVVVHPSAKDESDTELALDEALRRGATRILVIGAFGGSRLEHTVANLLLLCLPQLAGLDVRIADGASEVRLLDGGLSLTVDGQLGDFVSLFPLAPTVDGVTTSGLAFPLSDEPLMQGPARGLSNLMNDERATVSARNGRLLVVHTRLDQ